MYLIIFAPLHKQRTRIKKYLKQHDIGYLYYRHAGVFIVVEPKREKREAYHRWIKKQLSYGEECETYMETYNHCDRIRIFRAFELEEWNTDKILDEIFI